MNLTHTTHAGYIRQDDVYTDENGVNYTVCQDTDAEDPGSWLSHEEAAIVVINADRNTRTDNIDDYDDTIDGGESAEGVFGEILVTRGV